MGTEIRKSCAVERNAPQDNSPRDVLISTGHGVCVSAPFRYSVAGVLAASGAADADAGATVASDCGSAFFAATALRLATLLFATFFTAGFAAFLPAMLFAEETGTFFAAFLTADFVAVAAFFAAPAVLETAFLATALRTAFFATAPLAGAVATPSMRNFVRSGTSAIQAGGRAWPLHVAPVFRITIFRW